MSNAGSFTLGGSSLESITPRQFGYWSVRWAHDNTLGQLETLLNKKNNVFPFVNSIREIQFPAYLQFLALHAASYWTYAVLVLVVEVPAIHEMGIGMDDALKEIGDPDGKPFSEDLKSLFKKSFATYYKSITDDFRAGSDPRVYDPDINNVAKIAVHIFSQFYPDLKITSANADDDAQVNIDRHFLGNMVADVTPSLYKILRDDIGLGYRR